ncbi:c-type cytochrome [Sphingomonas sp. NCPPB 2930]
MRRLRTIGSGLPLRMLQLLAALAVAAVALGALAFALAHRGEAPPPAAAAGDAPASPDQVRRGAYLARAGDCIACHTTAGGRPFAGGVALPTPFGTLYSSNLTPDAETGLGRWSAAEFWRAMHHGVGRDGRMLYPAFPYPNYTRVTREDSDALFAYLQALAPVSQPNRPHALRFPFDTQVALAAWRALYFTPGGLPADARRSAEWNRGAYLVEGLGHCSACHSPRNALGATSAADALEGGRIPQQGWYAPSLHAAHEAGLGAWSVADIVQLLRVGVAPGASASGPMAEVVSQSLQHLSTADLQAMAVYLKALPQTGSAPDARPVADAAVLARGGGIYAARCAQCHGESGQGTTGLYPALAGNRAVALPQADNLVQMILRGGYQAQTAGNPRPVGMPPFQHLLDDGEVAAVATFVRASWGHTAAPVSALEVQRVKESSP